MVGVGGVAVLMMVFEEVDEIERMKAFGLAAAIGIYILDLVDLDHYQRTSPHTIAAPKRAHARSAGSPDCCEQVPHRIC